MTDPVIEGAFYTDTGPFAAGQQYYWRVRGVNNAGPGQYANREYATPDPQVVAPDPDPPPPPPPGDTVPESLQWAPNLSVLPVGWRIPGSGGDRNTTVGSGIGRFRIQYSGNDGLCYGEVVDSVPRVGGGTNPIYEGNRAIKLHVSQNHVNGVLINEYIYRADINGGSGQAYYAIDNQQWEGLVLWVGYAMYLDPNWPVPGPHGCVLGQFHNRSWVDPFYNVSPTGTIRIRDNTDSVDWTSKYIDVNDGYIRKERSLSLAPNNLTSTMVGVWTRWVYQIKLSSLKTGFVRVWRDNQLLAEAFNIETHPPEPRAPYFLNSHYSANMQRVAGPAKSMYYCSMRHAREDLGGNYATVDPASYASQ